MGVVSKQMIKEKYHGDHRFFQKSCAEYVGEIATLNV